MTRPTWSGYRRADGSAGVRNHVFVLPVVVCSTLVSVEVARATGAVSMVHQHGCGHIGNDVEHTELAYAGMARNPDVGATVVMSLGCETLQGRRVASRIAGAGGRVELVGIQSSGGADAARAAAIAAAAALGAEIERRREPVDWTDLCVGVHLGRSSASADGLVARLLGLGSRIVLCGAADAVAGLLGRLGVDAAPAAFGSPSGDRIAWIHDEQSTGRSHVALAAGGAAVIVSAPDAAQAPSGVPIVPVLAVGTGAGLHGAIADDFDLNEQAGPQELWDLFVATCEGRLTASERRGSEDVVIPRLRRTM